MYLFVFVLLFLAILYGPQRWARHILARYNRKEYFSGTGLEFARLLVGALDLKEVKVEVSLSGDHYDPEKKCVALGPAFAERRTLAAVVVASHEVAHAQQAAQGYPPFYARIRLIKLAEAVERAGYLVFILLPLVGLVTRSPIIGVFMLVGAGFVLIMPLLVHLITLPVELDASFHRALPLLMSGPYIPEEDLPAARRILIACALTYVVAALAGFFNLWRWARVLRR
ncbi:zinc metallopeptidase [Desulfoluna sp.]|uniref:zinc metallopeptidase n=1 Tax=Desulfoluna sp. TaxID=2045199 RepID=UPI00263902EF|nr:zinc metallopeptidase [Desulfoluna sp.]